MAACPAAAGTADLTSVDLEQLLQFSVVSASKYEQKQSEVAAAASVITRQDIKTFGWHTLDQALASLPGIYTTYDRQYTYVGMRGFGLPGDFNTRVLVMIDGNRVNDVVYDGGPFGNQFPLDMALVERIEFIPGPGGAVYGQNAMFGVVNVITRSGKEMGGTEVAATLQQPQLARSARLSWGKVLDNGVDVLLSASGLRSRGQDHFFDFGSAGVSGVAAGMDGESDRELFVRLARGAWSFHLVYGDRSKDDPAGAFHGDPLVGGQLQADRYTLAQLQYQGKLDDAGRLQLMARGFVGQERYYGPSSNDGSLYSVLTVSQWRGAELRLLSTAVDSHKLMLGAEYQDNTKARQNIDDLSTAGVDVGVPSPGYRAGIYAQDEWRMVDAVTGILGLRLDRNDIIGSTASPRAGLIWQANATTTIKGLTGHAQRAPNAYERGYGNDGWAQVANPQLRGERIETREIVIDHRARPDLTVRSSIYDWTMRGLITEGVDPLTGFAQYQSGQTVRASGIELSADRAWTGGARLRGSVTYQDVAYENGTPILNAPQMLARLNASRALPLAGWRVGYEMLYDSQRLTVAGTHTGGYVISNIHFSTESPARGFELFVGIQNLFDKHYEHPAADTNWQNTFEQDGRSLRLGAAYRF